MSDSAPENGPTFGHRLHPMVGRGSAGAPAEDLHPPVAPGLDVGRLLGRGGFSSAWLVTDDLGRRFALKVAAPPVSGAGSAQSSAQSGATAVPGAHGRRAARQRVFPGSSAVDSGGPGSSEASESVGTKGPSVGTSPGSLERELRLLQRFRHEHLLTVHRMVETDQGAGMLAELAPGGSLLALIASRGPLPLSEVVTALAPVAQVLAYLHGEGVTHGDVTPGNILFTSEGKPLLGDLGTGRLLGAVASTPVGTPGFTDPLTDGTYDVGVDVFALAAVCWFALTGRTPGPTQQRPPLGLMVPEVGPALMEVIEDGLSETEDRRPTADDLARVLLASATPSPVNLVSAVHASVLPELLTQRVADRGSAAGAKKALSGRRNPKRPDAHPHHQRRLDDPASATTREGHRLRRGVAFSGAALAAVLLGVGAALAMGGSGDPAGPDSGTTGRIAAGQRTAEVPQDAGTAGIADDDEGEPALPGRGGVPPASDGPRSGEGAGGSSDAGADATSASVEEASVTARDTDPVVALAGLAALRAHAFTEADVELLHAVDVGGSPAMLVDLEAVGTLAEAEKTLEDLSITLRDPVVLTVPEVADHPVADLPAVAAPPERTEVALVRATAALSSYTEASAEPGPDAQPAPLMAAGLQELIFVLWDSGTGWRIHTVALATA